MERRQKKTVIRTRFPTIEETAKSVGVSRKRLVWLIKLMEDIQKEEAEKINKSKNKPRSKKKPRK